MKKNKLIISVMVAALLIVIDQLVKIFVLEFLKPLGIVTAIDGLLEFTYVENTGVAFGLFQNTPWITLVATAIGCLVVTILALRYKYHNFLSVSAAVLIISGGIGNIIDRFIYGFVVDYIHVMFFDYVFNFADCCVSVGAVLLVGYILFFNPENGKRTKLGKSTEEEKKEEV